MLRVSEDMDVSSQGHELIEFHQSFVSEMSKM